MGLDVALEEINHLLHLDNIPHPTPPDDLPPKRPHASNSNSFFTLQTPRDEVTKNILIFNVHDGCTLS